MRLPRETVEYLPLTVELDGEATAYSVSVVAPGARHGTWSAGPYLITGKAVGHYHAWVKVTDTPEVIVSGPIPFEIT